MFNLKILCVYVNMSDIRHYFGIVNSNVIEKSNGIINSITTNIKNSDVIHVFTDGSSINNGSRTKKHYGGIGIYIENTNEEISETLEGKITNNIAELKACIRAINHIKSKSVYNNKKIRLYSDSEYVINSITKWAINWQKNNWKKYDKRKKQKVDIKNKDLIIELYGLYKMFAIEFIHVKAHKLQPNNDEASKEYKLWNGNHIADKLAVKASLKK